MRAGAASLFIPARNGAADPGARRPAALKP
jgi:hypothetical protein